MTPANSLSTDNTRADRTTRLNGMLSLVGTGDREAFAEFYDEVSAMVFGTAVRVLRDRDHAAEVTQEVMIEVWRTAPRFNPESGSAPSWVATMAHRRAVDRVRAVQAQRERDQHVLDRHHERGWDVVADEVELRDEHRRVADCLESLSPIQRDAVRRTYYDGLTYREAAEQADVALPTMKTRIRDALVGLSRCLGLSS